MATNLYGKSCTPNLGGVSDFYTKAEINQLLSRKADSGSLNQDYVDGRFDALSLRIDGLDLSKVSYTYLESSLVSLQTEIETDIATIYATKSDTYTKAQVNSLVSTTLVSQTSFIRKIPATTEQNTIRSGSNNSIALTVQGSTVNPVVTQWLDGSSNRLAYINSDGSTVFENSLTIGRLAPVGSSALDLQGKRISSVADPVSDYDAVPYSFLRTYVLDFYDEISRSGLSYTLNAGTYSTTETLRDSYRHLNSSIAFKRPLVSDLLDGEIAVNYNEQSPGLFIRDTGGKIRKLGPAHIGDSAPVPNNYTDLSDGELWIDRPNELIKYYDELKGEWVRSGVSAGIRHQNCIYVSKNGSDTNNGSVDSPLLTIKAAAALAMPGDIVRVAPGVYTETELPIRWRRDVSVFGGGGLRSTIIQPAPGQEFNDIFKVDSGFWCWGFSFAGHQADETRQAWAVSFDELADNTDVGAVGLGAHIFKSPYVQNCTSITAEDDSGVAPSQSIGNTGGGLNIDGDQCSLNTPIRSMVVDSYTHVNLGGPGCLIQNDGYAQLVSFFGLFCTYHVRCETGGQANLSGGGTSDFGIYGLMADGYSTSPVFIGKSKTDVYGTLRLDRAVTIDPTTDIFTSVDHSLIVNDRVYFSVTQGLLPDNVESGKIYYVISDSFTADTFKVSETLGGTALDVQGTATGTYEFVRQGETQIDLIDFSANRLGRQAKYPLPGGLGSPGNSVFIESVDGNSFTVTLDPSAITHEYVAGGTGTVNGTATFPVSSAVYDNVTGSTVVVLEGYTPQVADLIVLEGLSFICNSSSRPYSGQLMFPTLVFPRNSTTEEAETKTFPYTRTGDYTLTYNEAPSPSGPDHEYVSGGFVLIGGVDYGVANAVYDQGTGLVTITTKSLLPAGNGNVTIGDLEFICPSSAYIVTSSIPINATGDVVDNDSSERVGYRVLFFSGSNGGLRNPIYQGQKLDFRNRSLISAPSHTFEYVGTGTNYDALPWNGGVPVRENSIVEVNNGRVYSSNTNERGDFAVGSQFFVDGTTGSVTIKTDQFNLSGLNFIGPFSRNGGISSVGVQLREVSNNTSLIASTGAPDGNTVPTQVAVKTYVDDKFLKDVTVTNNSPLSISDSSTQTAQGYWDRKRNLLFSPGSSRQLLQTSSDGNNVEWTSNVDIPGTLDVTGVATFDTKISIGTAEPATSREVGWNADRGTLEVGLLNGVKTTVGPDTITLCRNDSPGQINKGAAVMFTPNPIGNSGLLTVAPMVADGTYPGYIFFGIAAQNIASGENGYIISFGEIKGIDTDALGFNVGDILWCDPATPGGLTNIEPVSPNLRLAVAAVITRNNNGIIMVRWNTSNSVSGSSGQLIYNNAGVYDGAPGSFIDGSGNISLSSRLTLSKPGTDLTPALSLTGTWPVNGTGTTTKPQLLIEPSGTTSNTWNTSGTGLGVNAPSGFTGNLLDLQVDGSRILNVNSTGKLAIPSGSGTTTGLQIGSSINLDTNGSSTFCIRVNNDRALQLGPGGLYVNTYNLGGDGGGPSLTRDSTANDAERNTLAQRNGTNAQTYRLYNTYTDASNYERVSFKWDTNTFKIEPEAAGTGILRSLAFSANGAASTPPLKLTGTWFVGANSQPHLLIEPNNATPSTTWTTSGTGLGINAPSGFAGNLLDLQVGGASKVRYVDSESSISGSPGEALYTPLIRVRKFYGSAFIYNGTNTNNSLKIGEGFSGFLDIAGNDGGVGFNFPNGAVRLTTDGGHILAQRNGTNAQTYRLYNTYTNGSNYERVSFKWDANTFKIEPEASGTGILRSLAFSANGAASTPPLKLTGTWFVGANSQPQFLIEPSGTTSTTWSTSGTGLGVNAPSGFTGNLLDLQANGTSRFRIGPAGDISFNNGFGTLSISGYGLNSNLSATFANCKTAGAGFRGNYGVLVATSNSIGWTSNLDNEFICDLILARDAADTLAQRNGTNAQTYRLYNTYTDASNYERVSFKWDTNTFKIEPEASGTGTLRSLAFSANGAASTPPLKLTGTWFSGGTATTTKPQFLIEPAGTTSNTWNTSGTGLGINAPSGFSGNLLELKVGGVSYFSVRNSFTQFMYCNAVAGQNYGLVATNSGTYALRISHILNGNVSGGGVYFSQPGAFIKSGTPLSFSGDIAGNGFNNCILRGFSGILEQSGGTISQTYRVYGTFTDSNNYVRAALSATSTAVTLAAETAGTGADDIDLNLTAAGLGNVRVNSDLRLSDAKNIVLSTTTGTKIGTDPLQKLAFYNATPVTQPAAVSDIATTATAGSLPTPDGSVTIADASAPTNAELLEYCTELEAKLESALAALRSLGLISSI